MQLTLDQYALLDMPDAFAGEELDLTSQPVVEFSVPFGKEEQNWTGFVTGTRASLNEQSRQITVVARIDNPYERREGRNTTLKIGQYLNASIEGRTFEDIYVLPPGAVRQNRDVLQMRDNKVHIAPVKVIWSTEGEVVVTSEEDLQDAPIIITSLGQATEGMKVALPGQKKKPGRPGGKPGGKPEGGSKPEGGRRGGKPEDGERKRGQGQRPTQGESERRQGKRPQQGDGEGRKKGQRGDGKRKPATEE